MESTPVRHHDAWNQGKLVGQKAPFKRKEIWAIRAMVFTSGSGAEQWRLRVHPRPLIA